jgi:hypothetical protein
MDNCQVDVIYTDFAKAFDRVDHELLIIILGKLGFSHPLLSWFKFYLKNRSSSPKYTASIQRRSLFHLVLPKEVTYRPYYSIYL